MITLYKTEKLNTNLVVYITDQKGCVGKSKERGSLKVKKVDLSLSGRN